MMELLPGVLYDVVTIRHITVYRDVIYQSRFGGPQSIQDMKGVEPGTRGKLRLVHSDDAPDRQQYWDYKFFLEGDWYAYLGSAGPMFRLVHPLQLLAEAAE